MTAPAKPKKAPVYKCISNGLGGIGSYFCDDPGHKHQTGYCEAGLHEGEKPRSAQGVARKTCPMINWCKCSCHADITEMFQMTGRDRIEVSNPQYEPVVHGFVMPDLQRVVEVKIKTQTVQFDAEKPPVFTETPSGKVQRGQLEYETKLAVEAWLADPDREACTTKWISQWIFQYRGGDGKLPSQGAIRDVLLRWQNIGYCNVATGPFQFDGLTIEGMRDGLDKLRAVHALKVGK